MCPRLVQLAPQEQPAVLALPAGLPPRAPLAPPALQALLEPRALSAPPEPAPVARRQSAMTPLGSAVILAPQDFFQACHSLAQSKEETPGRVWQCCWRLGCSLEAKCYYLTT